MRRLHSFFVFAKPEGESGQIAVDDLKLVNKKWSLAATFFHVIWCLYHRLWMHAWLVFVAFIIIELLMLYGILTNMLALSLLELTLMIWVGFSAGDWLRNDYMRKGYQCLAVVTAYSELEAKRRFLEQYC